VQLIHWFLQYSVETGKEKMITHLKSTSPSTIYKNYFNTRVFKETLTFLEQYGMKFLVNFTMYFLIPSVGEQATH